MANKLQKDIEFAGKNYKKRDGLEALRRSKGHIKSLLAKRVNMRKIPDLDFIVDDSLDKAERIDDHDVQQKPRPLCRRCH